MIVNDDSNIVLTVSVDEIFDLSEVVHVIDTFLLLDCFPHDAESKNLDSPVSHLLHVLISHGRSIVEPVLRRQIRRQFDHNVSSVEDPRAPKLISKSA